MPMMDRADEHVLIRKAKAGDGSAIESLIRAHQEALYAFMLRLSGRPDVAEDIAQDAFVRVLKNLDRFDTQFRFSTWLFTIAKRLYVNASQKQKPVYDSEHLCFLSEQGSQRHAPSPGDLHEAPGVTTARAETLDNARCVIDAALADLSMQQREIVLLFHQQNWPISEIATYLNMPEGTVKSHLHRARKRMREFIEKDEMYSAHAHEVWT